MRVVLRVREWRRKRSHATISRDQVLSPWLGLGYVGFEMLVCLLFLVPPAVLGYLA